jgi:hypothetical protein
MEIQDAKQARPHCELIAELLDSRQPKTEREHAAEREIERLRHDIERHIAIASEHATECERLRAELAARDTKPDCRTCDHYIPPLSFAGEPACEFANTESVLVCVNGDAYIGTDPVRLYETGEA